MIQELVYRIEECERRIANMIRCGRVVPGSQDASGGTIKLMDGDDQNDPDGYVSGAIPWKEHSGGLSTRTMPTDNQQIMQLAPGGNLELAWATHGGYMMSDNMPSAPNGESVYRKTDGTSNASKSITVSDSTDGKRTETITDTHTRTVGDYTITHDKDNGITITAGDVSLSITKSGFAFKGGKVTHNDLPIDATHKHTDVMPGSGLTGIPSA